MILKFEGVVEVKDDPCRVESGDGWVWIGGKDFLAEVEPAKFSGPVTIALADARFTGDTLLADVGYGYSEFTPVDCDKLKVDELNVIQVLAEGYAGQTVTLWIADEPIDFGAEL